MIQSGRNWYLLWEAPLDPEPAAETPHALKSFRR